MAVIAGTVAAVSTVAGGVVAARGAKKAAKTQAAAAREAGNIQDAQYQQNRQDRIDAQANLNEGIQKILPQYDANIEMGRNVDARTQALSGALGPQAQAKAFSEYQMSPGQQWRMDQGLKLTEQELAASGIGGGTRYRAMRQRSQDLADQNFAEDYNRLAAQGDMGRGDRDNQTRLRLDALAGDLSASQDIATMGTQSAIDRSNTLGNVAAARAGGQLGKANAIGGTLSGLGQIGGQVLGGMGGKSPAIESPVRYQNGLPQSSGTGGYTQTKQFWQ